jgi:hypothetical protein
VNQLYESRLKLDAETLDVRRHWASGRLTNTRQEVAPANIIFLGRTARATLPIFGPLVVRAGASK